MKKNEILEDEKISNSNETIKLPTNFITIGEVDVDDVKIYIKQDVYKRIEKFSKQDTSNERGGILIGDYDEINDKKNVIITAFIEAKYTDASASTLTFTHETWNYIHKEHEELYSEKKILGWQHTHPDYGIFLSNYDIFIQENFFNLPWQIAYVVDPIAETRGFFQWKNTKIEPTGGFYIFDDMGKKIKIKQENSSKSNEKVSLFSILMTVLTTISLIVAVFFVNENYNIVQKFNELIFINTKITEENNELSQKLQQSNGVAQKSQQGSEVAPKEQQNDNSSKTTMQSNETGNDIVKMKVYTVQNGDTLNTICQNNNIDYFKKKSIILKMNDITNEDRIYCGQKIYLPLD